MALTDTIWGKKNLQWLFERFRAAAMKGMNYGRASDYTHNGETLAIHVVMELVNSPSAVLFDVGANKGQFTRRILEEWSGMTYQLYAFEPSRKTFEDLRNSLPERSYVHLVNRGLGEKPESVRLYYDKEGSSLASLYKRDIAHRNIEMSEYELIDLTTVDIFCKQNHIESIDFLKLDVEGHELAVLKGGSRMFESGNIRTVQFEFGGCNIDSRTYFRDFYNFFKGKFRLYRILSNGLQPIDHYSEELEVFLSANYLAIRID